MDGSTTLHASLQMLKLQYQSDLSKHILLSMLSMVDDLDQLVIKQSKLSSHQHDGWLSSAIWLCKNPEAPGDPAVRTSKVLHLLYHTSG